MQFDFIALSEDLELERVRLFKVHCEQADQPLEAAIALASELQRQAMIVLQACYGGDKLRAKLHALAALS